MRFLILLTLLISNLSANEIIHLKNIVIHKEPKTYNNIIFLDKTDQKTTLNDFNKNLIILNFWATWCEPCKEELPSLDRLQINPKLNNLKVLPINIGQEKQEVVDNFFKNLNVKNLTSYFDPNTSLAKEFSLRGVPTSVLFNKEGKEFARIIGSINFDDEKFINWLSNYN